MVIPYIALSLICGGVGILLWKQLQVLHRVESTLSLMYTELSNTSEILNKIKGQDFDEIPASEIIKEVHRRNAVIQSVVEVGVDMIAAGVSKAFKK